MCIKIASRHALLTSYILICCHEYILYILFHFIMFHLFMITPLLAACKLYHFVLSWTFGNYLGPTCQLVIPIQYTEYHFVHLWFRVFCSVDYLAAHTPWVHACSWIFRCELHLIGSSYNRCVSVTTLIICCCQVALVSEWMIHKLHDYLKPDVFVRFLFFTHSYEYFLGCFSSVRFFVFGVNIHEKCNTVTK